VVAHILHGTLLVVYSAQFHSVVHHNLAVYSFDLAHRVGQAAGMRSMCFVGSVVVGFRAEPNRFLETGRDPFGDVDGRRCS